MTLGHEDLSVNIFVVFKFVFMFLYGFKVVFGFGSQCSFGIRIFIATIYLTQSKNCGTPQTACSTGKSTASATKKSSPCAPNVQPGEDLAE